MKKIVAFVLCLVLLGSSAHAYVPVIQAEKKHTNILYSVMTVGPFLFAATAGFQNEGNIGENPIWMNARGQTFQAIFIPDNISFFSDHEEVLNDLEELFIESSLGDLWCGASYAEKSGGCYKIGGIIKKDDLELFGIYAFCPDGMLTIIYTPENPNMPYVDFSSDDMDLIQGIFDTISYIEYEK